LFGDVQLPNNFICITGNNRRSCDGLLNILVHISLGKQAE